MRIGWSRWSSLVLVLVGWLCIPQNGNSAGENRYRVSGHACFSSGALFNQSAYGGAWDDDASTVNVYCPIPMRYGLLTLTPSHTYFLKKVVFRYYVSNPGADDFTTNLVAINSADGGSQEVCDDFFEDDPASGQTYFDGLWYDGSVCETDCNGTGTYCETDRSVYIRFDIGGQDDPWTSYLRPYHFEAAQVG